MQQAVASHQRGDSDQAIATCKQALLERPDEPEALHLAATLYASAGKLDEALPYAARASQSQAGNSRYLHTLGRLLNATGRGQEAEVLFRRAIRQDPSAAIAWQGLAAALSAQAMHDDALETLRQGTERLGEPQLYREYALALAGVGQLDEAAIQLERCLAAYPGDEIASNNLGIIRLRQGRPAQAVEIFRAVLERQPGATATLGNLGIALQACGRFRDALACYDALAGSRDLQAGERASRGSILLSLGERSAALAVFEEVLSIEPGHAGALAGKAELLELAGRYEEGLAVLAPFHEREGADPIILLAAARLLRRVGRTKEAIDLLAPLVARQTLEGSLLRRALFTLGELYDEVGEFQLAFRQIQRAHRMNPRTFDMDRHRQWVRRCIETFAPASVRDMLTARRGEPEVIFIVGMPRSGTSLVEQILASHFAVHALGERPDIGVLARQLLPRLMQNGLQAVDPDVLSALAENYRRGAGDLPPAIQFMTDKMPLNFLYLGLVAMLFPGARIVHCRRNPMDTALSCYFTDFLDPALAFAEDLEGIAAYYQEYRRLMAHWQAVTGLRIFDLVYEDLVREQEHTTRTLLGFVGLPWDERCLNFQDSGRRVDTASHAQVRRALYKSSVGRSKNYAAQLACLHDALCGS